MSWLLPSVLAIGGVAAFVAIGLHFIARSRPLAEPLPTARFVPEQPVQARARSIALSDLLLLLVRVAAIVALTAGAAGPVLSPRGRVSRVIVVDRSRAVASVAEMRDSIARYARTGDRLVVFDSAALHSASTLDSIAPTTARGSLSAALAAGIRTATFDAERSDSIEIVLVSPFAVEETDAATFEIRHTWPGRIRVVRVSIAKPVTAPSRVEVVAPPNDAIAAGLGLIGARATGNVRVIRTTPSAADSSWARANDGVLVVWPSEPASVSWRRRPNVDTIGAVASGSGTLVAAFPRVWSLSGAAIARWADGAPAAVETPLGGGCTRDVGILIDPSSDITLRMSFRAFVAALIEPCGGVRDAAVLGATALTTMAGGASLAPAAALRDPSTDTSHATPWLLAIGAVLLIVELGVRRGTRKLA